MDLQTLPLYALRLHAHLIMLGCDRLGHRLKTSHGGTQSRCWQWRVALTLREMTLHYVPANEHEIEHHTLMKMLIYPE